MSTPESDPYKHLRERQLALVRCLEALQTLPSAEQVRVLLTIGAFYDITRWVSARGE